MRILAIETSCDETAISLLQTNDGKTFDVLAHEISSQIDVHKEWGGVVPMLAKREHLINLPLMLEKVLPDLTPSTSQPVPDLIAVTYGPGLEPALWTGILFAKDLANKWNVPLVATDHMAGHIYSALLKPQTSKIQSSTKPQDPNLNLSFELCDLSFPAVALLISGGHTELVLLKDLNSFEIKGRTRDDAVGEAFDKVARILGLPYPGGPEISKLAEKYQLSKLKAQPNPKIQLPRPMIHSKDLDFSFSGLKTAVLYLVKKITEENKRELMDDEKIEIAHEFEQAVTEVLISKTVDAINKYETKSLLVGGGVIANKTIREALRVQTPKPLALHLPDNRFTGDNATMIGIAAYLHSKRGTANLLPPNSPELEALKATGNLSLYN